MPVAVRRPFKWSTELKAWADGLPVQCRTYVNEQWTPWRMSLDAPMRDDVCIEYRVQPDPVQHKWQREREAFLAGKYVEFRSIYGENPGTWIHLDEWMEETCRDGRNSGGPIWDRSWLEFRITEDKVIKYYYVATDDRPKPIGRPQGSNLKLLFVDNKLESATAVRH